jgi:GlpG protein
VPHQFDSFRDALGRVPVTLALIALSVTGFLLYYLGAPLSWISELTYYEFTIDGREIAFQRTEGEYWRLITPIFLHFGWLHITFNSLWTWEIGALIERRLGGGLLLLLVLLCGAGSNVAQAVYSGPSLFGGMSGVVYGLLGFCWVHNLLFPDRFLSVPRGIIAFMLIWLVFCMVAPTELLGIGSIANAAHLAGLVLGCAIAVPVALLRRYARGGDP